jgi:hypothetical protein
VEDVLNSRKLVRLGDLGDRVLSILAGLKIERSDLSALIGTQSLSSGYLSYSTAASAETERGLIHCDKTDARRNA